MNEGKTDYTTIETLLKADKHDEAFPLIVSTLEDCPGEYKAWHYMGCFKLFKRDLDQARACFEKALALEPDFASSLYNSGNIARMEGRFEDAERLFGRVKELEPDSIIPPIRPPRRVVYIAIPNYGLMRAEFVQSLIAMVLSIKPQDNIDFIVRDCMGSRITSNRNRMVQDALKNGATHIFFIDSDMKFPPFALHRLLSHNVDIACATACKRGDEDGTPIGVAVAPDGCTDTHRQVSSGMVEMALVGSCFMIIDLKVFSDIGLPAYYEPPNYSDGDAFGEDITFCKLVRKAGYKIWMDFDISRMLGHVGEKTYYIKPKEPVRDAA